MLSPMDSTVNSSGDGAGAGTSADYRKKRIKNVQKLELVRLMKAHFLFIRGKHAVARSEKSRSDVWKMITARLNSLGPPVQSPEAWQRRWNDMRSATKSKMAKIQNYVREHGEECPYKLNMVERLIWDTFSVKPEEYMKDLNMKWWREKQQHHNQQSSAMPMTIDSPSGGSLNASLHIPGFEPEPVRNNDLLEPPIHTGGTSWQESNLFGTDREVPPLPQQSCVRPNLEPVATQTSDGVAPTSVYPQATCGMGYNTYQGPCATQVAMCVERNVGEIDQWHQSVSSSGVRESEAASQSKPPVPSDMVHGSKLLRDLNKLFDLVLKQNEEILNLLRQSGSDS